MKTMIFSILILMTVIFQSCAILEADAGIIERNYILQREIKNVQNPSIEYLKSIGWSAIHPSPTQYPGYPDVEAKNLAKYLLIEVKDFTDFSDTYKIKDGFTKYQVPWMVNNYKQISNIYLLIKIDSYFYYVNVNYNVIDDIYNGKTISFIKGSYYKAGSIKAAIDDIISKI